MPALAQHVTLRLQHDRVIASTLTQRRELARVVLRHGRGFKLLAFAQPDMHLHLEPLTERAPALDLARRIACALRRQLRIPVPFEPARTKPIRDAWHLRNVLEYILTQHRRHDIRDDPLYESTNLPDLLGLRLIGDHTVNLIREHVPRLRRSDVLGWVGLENLSPADGPLEEIRAAALAATAQGTLAGSSREAIATRIATLHIIGDRLPVREKCLLLGVSRAQLFRLRAREPNPHLVRAIQLQLGLIALRRQQIDASQGAFDGLPTPSHRDTSGT